MPAPHNDRQALGQERAELPDQIAAYQRDLAATPAENKARRERLEWPAGSEADGRDRGEAG
jgi:hypothetical protein